MSSGGPRRFFAWRMAVSEMPSLADGTARGAGKIAGHRNHRPGDLAATNGGGLLHMALPENFAVNILHLQAAGCGVLGLYHN